MFDPSQNLKHLLKVVTLENLVSHRGLLHDGKLVLIGQINKYVFLIGLFMLLGRSCCVCLHYFLLHTENAKMHEVYLFLFDEFLLITKIKRSKKVRLLISFKHVYKDSRKVTIVWCYYCERLSSPVSVDINQSMGDASERVAVM